MLLEIRERLWQIFGRNSEYDLKNMGKAMPISSHKETEPDKKKNKATICKEYQDVQRLFQKIKIFLRNTTEAMPIFVSRKKQNMIKEQLNS